MKDRRADRIHRQKLKRLRRRRAQYANLRCGRASKDGSIDPDLVPRPTCFRKAPRK